MGWRPHGAVSASFTPGVTRPPGSVGNQSPRRVERFLQAVFLRAGIAGDGWRVDVTSESAGVVGERRVARGDRRRRFVFSLFYGGLKPRRRNGRRATDHHRPIIDWHGPELLASSILVLVLCVADALLTLWLMTQGASEANPLMAPLLGGDVRHFAIAKLALTGGGIVTLVALANVRIFRTFKVGTLVHTVLVAYLVLVSYELALVARTA